MLAARRKITDCVSIRSNRYVKSTNRAPVQDGPDIRYVLRDVDDPGAMHAIHRSFIGKMICPQPVGVFDRLNSSIFLQVFLDRRWIES